MYYPGKNARQTCIHPGKVLKDVYLVRHNMALDDLASTIKEPLHDLDAFVRGDLEMSQAFAVKLAAIFKTDFWLKLHKRYVSVKRSHQLMS